MRVERCGTAEAFLEATLGYRAAEPLRTNVISTVAASVVADPDRYESCRWWLVRERGGELLGAAFRTAPMPMSLGPMSDVAAAAIARDATDADPDLPGVIGRPTTVAAFCEHYTTSTGPVRFTLSRRDVLYAVEHVATPIVPGAVEVATTADTDLAATWFDDFVEVIDGARPEPSVRRRSALDETIRDRRLHWWRDAGTIVSMAAHTPTVAVLGTHVTRIGPVFTPEAHRRHGYGAAVTAAVSTALLERGSSVMLFADEANPTSNSIYRKIGYRQTDVFDVMTRVRPGA
jgi:predicted GNAT family acetyltransferase